MKWYCWLFYLFQHFGTFHIIGRIKLSVKSASLLSFKTSVLQERLKATSSSGPTTVQTGKKKIMHSLQAQLVWNSIVFKGRWFVQLYIHIHTATPFYGQAHVVVAVVVVVVTKVSSHHHRHRRHHRLTLRCATTTRLIINRTTTTTTGPQTLPCQDRSSVRGLQAVVAGVKGALEGQGFISIFYIDLQ